jgi:hypothetical protein
MIRELPAREWRTFLETFGRAHFAWLATIHIVDPRGTVTRSPLLPLTSTSSSREVIRLDVVDDRYSICAHRPCALRIQQSLTGAIEALEIDTAEGHFIRLAFRATALPEQLDGLAPGESACVPGGATLHS